MGRNLACFSGMFANERVRTFGVRLACGRLVGDFDWIVEVSGERLRGLDNFGRRAPAVILGSGRS